MRPRRNKRGREPRGAWSTGLLSGGVLPALALLACCAVAVAAPEPGEQFDWSNLTIDRGDLHVGGPGKDGISSLKDPPSVPAAEADFLPADARVIGVRLPDGTARAYPIAVLNWHETINDTLGDLPIAVIYGPLCDSVSVVVRRLDEQAYVFGNSGMLANSNVVLYDRTDHALYAQLAPGWLSGPNAGRSLPHLPWTVTTLGDWRERFPDSTVLSLKTGYSRPYRQNPYASYFRSEELYSPLMSYDSRLPSKTRVIGVRVGEALRAYPLADIRQGDVPGAAVTDTLGDKRVVLRAWGEESAEVVELPEGGEAVYTFWFAWAGFHPNTEIYGQTSEP